MGSDSAVHLFETERRRRREEQRARWELEHRARESEASRQGELARPHAPGALAPRSSHPGTAKPREGSLGPPASEVPRLDPPPLAWSPPDSEVPVVRLVPAGVGASGSSRVPGAPVLFAPPTFSGFLAFDALERFDIEALNVLPFRDLQSQSASEPTVRRAFRVKAMELIPRVKQETDDPAAAGSLLRAFVLRWYRDSPTEVDWSQRMPLRWGGLFADSRQAGGRLQPWLVRRLVQLEEGEGPSNPLHRMLKRHVPGASHRSHALERAPAQVWMAEAAQALLDDLAGWPREESGKIALVHLSELAARRSVDVVNEALARLTDAPPRGPFVLLHPSRYPDCDLVSIRAPSSSATGPSVSYHLLAAKPALSTSGPHPADSPSEGHAAGGMDAGEENFESWPEAGRSSSSWRGALSMLRQHRQHLSAPPTNFRQLPAYRALRELVLTDKEARELFLGVKWRGRPAGLWLLAALLGSGSFTPEVATDHEYLEAELSDQERGDPEWRPSPPSWAVPGGRVTRETTPGAPTTGTYRFIAGSSPT